MRIVATEVVNKLWDLEADRTLQDILTESGVDKPARDLEMVTFFRILRSTLYELVTEDETPYCIIIFLLLAGTEVLYRPICLENRHDFCFPHDERVKIVG